MLLSQRQIGRSMRQCGDGSMLSGSGNGRCLRIGYFRGGLCPVKRVGAGILIEQAGVKVDAVMHVCERDSMLSTSYVIACITRLCVCGVPNALLGHP